MASPDAERPGFEKTVNFGVITPKIWDICRDLLLRKEVIHPQLRLGIPCYDLVFIAEFTLIPPCGGASGTPDFARLTGGVYKERERIHRDLLIRDY